jgi:exopolyphosphatase/guanosine-5'-triphosphate,3'-diphosphate pyrophosphatase
VGGAQLPAGKFVAQRGGCSRAMTRRSAFIDVGTNTLLCLIVEVQEGGGFSVLDDLAEITRLGRGVDQTARIHSQGARRSLEVLQRYLARCRDLGVEEIYAVGTSALRDAVNSGEIRERFRERLGLDIRVLSGEEEAAYSFLAVQKSFPGQLVVVDIGGGSTEFIWGNEAGMERAVSLNVGTVRLTERFLHSDPAREPEWRRVVEAVDLELATLAETGPVPPAKMVGIAGTFTTLAAVEKQLVRYSHRDVHGSALTLAEVRRQRELFQQKTIEERKGIRGLEPKRADVILAGAIMIERIMVKFRADPVLVSDHGVRYGLLYERLQREN